MIMTRMVCIAATIAALTGTCHAATGKPAPAPAADPAKGKQVFDRWCTQCHGRGPGHPGTQSLAIKYRGSTPEALEDRTDLTPRLTALYVREGIQLMPFFRKTEISDRELADLAAYLAKDK
jgi:mono/diheme cytochrome c family protein